MKKRPENNLPDTIRYRLDAVFAAAAMTVLAGLLVPIDFPALDIAWICCLCLGAAVIIVCAAAKSCQELQGFGILAAGLSLLRICLAAMTVKKILLEQTGGVLVEFLGKIVLQTGAITAGIMGLLIVIVGDWIMILTAGQILHLIRSYSEEILPVKRAGLEADLSLNIISKEQAQTIVERIRSEMRFFGSMGAVAILTRCEAAAMISLIPIAMGIKVFTETMRAGYDAHLFEMISAESSGLSIIAVIPAVATGWGCIWLLSKDHLCLKPAQSEETEKSKVIELGKTDGLDTKEAELLNPDFAEKAHLAEQFKENIVDFEPDSEEEDMICRPVHSFKYDNIEQYYQHIIELITTLTIKPGQAILLSSPADTSLGVQTAVNTAMGLASNHRVLLIDAEPKRCAIARAFDLDKTKTQKSPQQTCIVNLFVFTAGNNEKQVTQRIPKTIEQISKKIDKILIYGPHMAESIIDKLGPNLHNILFVQILKESENAIIPQITEKCISQTILAIPEF